RAGWYFADQRKRIRFFKRLSLVASDVILIYLPQLNAGNKSLPYARSIPAYVQFMAMRIPSVEISDNGYSLGIRCPHGKISAGTVSQRNSVRTEFLIEFIMLARPEKTDIEVCK